MASPASRQFLYSVFAVRSPLGIPSEWSCRRVPHTKRTHIRHYAAAATACTSINYDTNSTNFSVPLIQHKPIVGRVPKKDTMPPGHPATVASLTTFVLPDCVRGTASDIELGRQMIDTWRKDGI